MTPIGQPAACAACATVLRLPSPPTATTAVPRAAAAAAASVATRPRSAGSHANNSPFRPCSASARRITACLASRSSAPAPALITNSRGAAGSSRGADIAARCALSPPIHCGRKFSSMPHPDGGEVSGVGHEMWSPEDAAVESLRRASLRNRGETSGNRRTRSRVRTAE